MPVSRTAWYFNGPCYLKSKISPQKEIIKYMSLHLIGSSILKVTKLKLSSLIRKIRHCKGQFLVSVSPIAKPFPQFTPFFTKNGLPKTIYEAQTNCIRVQKHIKLYDNPTPPPPGNLTRLLKMHSI